jgi:uncharacterized phage protein (TIGR02216 family)
MLKRVQHDGGRKGEFAESAARLSGFAGAVLGWSPGAFWRATPAELEAVVGALTGGADDTAPPDADMIAKLREAFPDG